MIKKGIIIDIQKSQVSNEIEYDDTRVDGMFYKVVKHPSKDGLGLSPIAYIFPIENRLEVEKLLKHLKELKDAYDKEVSRVYYQEMPKLR